MQELPDSVQIKDGLVYKYGEAPALELEGLKTRLAGAIAERSGLFIVPGLVSLDLDRKFIATEFVPGLKNLHEVVLENFRNSLSIFESAGRALATVHQQLKLPKEHIIPLPEYLMSVGHA